INFLAGVTDPGTDSSATSAMFMNNRREYYFKFLVTDQGVIYFNDSSRGILKVDPVTGNQTVFIPKTLNNTVYSNGEVTGLLSGATIQNVSQIALDFKGRLLIRDTNAFRRYDPT